MGHLLLVHFESGDEIHLDVLDIKHLQKISKYLQDICDICNNSYQGSERRRHYHNIVEEMLDYIYSNIIESIFCQSYVIEDFFKGKYEFEKIIHVAELGG